MTVSVFFRVSFSVSTRGSTCTSTIVKTSVSVTAFVSLRSRQHSCQRLTYQSKFVSVGSGRVGGLLRARDREGGAMGVVFCIFSVCRTVWLYRM